MAQLSENPLQRPICVPTSSSGENCKELEGGLTGAFALLLVLYLVLAFLVCCCTGIPLWRLKPGVRVAGLVLAAVMLARYGSHEALLVESDNADIEQYSPKSWAGATAAQPFAAALFAFAAVTLPRTRAGCVAGGLLLGLPLLASGAIMTAAIAVLSPYIDPNPPTPAYTAVCTTLGGTVDVALPTVMVAGAALMVCTAAAALLTVLLNVCVSFGRAGRARGCCSPVTIIGVGGLLPMLGQALGDVLGVTAGVLCNDGGNRSPDAVNAIVHAPVAGATMLGLLLVAVGCLLLPHPSLSDGPRGLGEEGEEEDERDADAPLLGRRGGQRTIILVAPPGLPPEEYAGYAAHYASKRGGDMIVNGEAGAREAGAPSVYGRAGGVHDVPQSAAGAYSQPPRFMTSYQADDRSSYRAPAPAEDQD